MMFFSPRKSSQPKPEIKNKINTSYNSDKNPFKEKREWEKRNFG